MGLSIRRKTGASRPCPSGHRSQGFACGGVYQLSPPLGNCPPSGVGSFRPLLKVRRHPREACTPRAMLRAPGALKRSTVVKGELCDEGGGAQMSPALDVLHLPKCSGLLGSSSASRPARISDSWAFRYHLGPQERKACLRKRFEPTPCSARRLPSQCWSEKGGLGAQGFASSFGCPQRGTS